MINQERFEKLLVEDESNYLEFKEELDLQSNSSKAKFLREVLSLANTPIRNGYVIIGVEDKTKALVGLKKNITEEQVQQVISEWCRPPIKCTYQNIEYKNKTFGVVEVNPLRPPYTLKKRTGYEEPSDNPKKPNKVNLRENQAFIRRGSIIEEATIDELLEMFQADTVDMSDVVTRLDYMNDSLEEIASRTIYFRNIGAMEEPNKVLETVFVSLTSALILGYLWNPTDTFALASLPITIATMVIASTLRITHFGVVHIISASLMIGIALSIWLNFGAQFTAIEDIMASSRIAGTMFHGIVGAGIGLIVGIVLMLWSPPNI
jgi:hypothetical protein